MDLFDMALPLTEPIDPNKDASMIPPKPYTSSSQELEFLSNAILSPAQPYSTAPVALQHNNESDLKARLPLVHGMARIRCPTLVLGIQSDILFPVSQQKEIAVALRQAGHQQVTYYELDSIFGHDTFLIDVVNVGAAVKGHLEGH
jgi:homoserine O-acetyltransferase